METKTVNLRDLPEELVRRAKAYAALSGLSLKDFMVRAMEEAMKNDIQVLSAKSAYFASGLKGKSRRKKSTQ